MTASHRVSGFGPPLATDGNVRPSGAGCANSMMDTPASLLIVDSDPDFCAHARRRGATPRGYRAAGGRRGADARRARSAAISSTRCSSISAPGADSAFELLSQLKHLSSDTEVIVMSERTSMAATIQWFDPDAFAFVRKSDIGQLFARWPRARAPAHHAAEPAAGLGAADDQRDRRPASPVRSSSPTF